MTEQPKSFSDPLQDASHKPIAVPPSMQPKGPYKPPHRTITPVISTTSSDHDILHAIHAEAVKTRKAAVTCSNILLILIVLFFLGILLGS
jgi:hypothetical protein